MVGGAEDTATGAGYCKECGLAVLCWSLFSLSPLCHLHIHRVEGWELQKRERQEGLDPEFPEGSQAGVCWSGTTWTWNRIIEKLSSKGQLSPTPCSLQESISNQIWQMAVQFSLECSSVRALSTSQGDWFRRCIALTVKMLFPGIQPNWTIYYVFCILKCNHEPNHTSNSESTRVLQGSENNPQFTQCQVFCCGDECQRLNLARS